MAPTFLGLLNEVWECKKLRPLLWSPSSNLQLFMPLYSLQVLPQTSPGGLALLVSHRPWRSFHTYVDKLPSVLWPLGHCLWEKLLLEFSLCDHKPQHSYFLPLLQFLFWNCRKGGSRSPTQPQIPEAQTWPTTLSHCYCHLLAACLNGSRNENCC